MEAFYEWDNHYTPYPYEPDAEGRRLDYRGDSVTLKID